jgi:hypothetical protein
MSMRGGSLYNVLGVAPGAEDVVVEAAFRALIKKYHPDQAAADDAGRTAAEVNAAYAVLKDSGRRSEYDQRLWLRDQGAVLQIAQPPAPAFNLAAWSGWTVSLLLGATVVVMAAGKIAPPHSNINPLAAQPDVAIAPPSAESAAEAFWSRAHIATGLVSTPAAEAATLPPPPAPVAAVPVPAEAEAKSLAQRPVDARAPRAKPPARSRSARAKARSEDQQFREREGYIY